MAADKVHHLNEAVRQVLQVLDESDELVPTSTGEHQPSPMWFIVTKKHEHGFNIPWDGSDSGLYDAVKSFKTEYQNHAMNERVKQLVLQACERLDKCPTHSNTSWVANIVSVDEEKIVFKAVCRVCMASDDPRYSRAIKVSQEYFISHATLTVGEPKALEASDELLNTRLHVDVGTQEVKEMLAAKAENTDIP